MTLPSTTGGFAGGFKKGGIGGKKGLAGGGFAKIAGKAGGAGLIGGIKKGGAAGGFKKGGLGAGGGGLLGK